MITESQVLEKLKAIKDPASQKDIVSLGFVANVDVKENKVVFDVNPQYQKQAEEAVLTIDGVQVVKAKPVLAQSLRPQNPLPNIKSMIAVSSCKGGVGKSTVAVHLAQEMASRGKKVGLIDADIYGPSIPTLLNLNVPGLHTNEKQQLIPIEHNNLKVMSMGFLLGNAPAVMRGPIVTRYVQQLLLATDWGELDYLFIDMPPGTGDIHLTITQSLPLSGAVIVTTPHTLSLVDVARGIIMFEKVHVPILGVIENMAYYQTPDSDTKHYLFGQSSAQKLEETFGVKTLSEIPVLEALSQAQSKAIGVSFIQEATDALLQSMRDVQKDSGLDTINFDADNIVLVWKNGEEWTVNNRSLRLISKDALSVNEVTGEQIIKPEDIRRDLAAKEVIPLGNYAIGVTWNDGHSSAIYPFNDIQKIAEIVK